MGTAPRQFRRLRAGTVAAHGGHKGGHHELHHQRPRTRTTVTTGTGTITLLGATQAHQSFSAAIGNSNTTTYLILSGNGIDWEVGVGTYTAAGNTLSRTTVLASSVGGAIPLAGTSLVSCTNPATQAGANGLLDQLFGSAQGTLIYRDASSWLGLAPGTAGQFLKTQGAGANPQWAAAGAGGGAGGLYAPDISAVPTQSSTGLSTWVNQGSATATDTTEGIFIDVDSGHASQILGKKTASVPGTPYSITILMNFFLKSATSNPFLCFGWTNGTAFHVLEALLVSAAGLELTVARWTNSSSFSANESGFPGPLGMCPLPMWCQIRDDGTNAIFKFGTSPKSLITAFSVAKSSGFLGSSGYSSIFVGGENAGNGQEAGIEILSWTQGT